ncbi:hypothetical protein VNO77_05108 [Canavalia gladiata]|uniref:Bulb-type lectin domain-containing protein n=1 Tax=Canavalia gladiata TaxID=3824 RepID=A0AAN9N2V3_CANGL
MATFLFLKIKHLLWDSSVQASPPLAMLEFGITICQKKTVVWVANRDNPINDTSGVLSINPHGNLVIHHNYTTFPIWSSNLSLSQSNTTNVIAQLSDIENLVLILNHTKTVIWQSFDHPTDTFLPNIRLGFDRRTNQSWSIQSWKTEDDPGTGEMSALNVSFVEDDNQIALSFHLIDKSLIYSGIVQQPGFYQAFIWDNQKGQWISKIMIQGTVPVGHTMIAV